MIFRGVEVEAWKFEFDTMELAATWASPVAQKTQDPGSRTGKVRTCPRLLPAAAFSGGTTSLLSTR